MRIRILNTAETVGGLRLARQGFTLTQLLVAMSIFLMVVVGSVTSHVYGLKMFDTTQSKLDANTTSRRVIDLLTSDIRSAYNLQIGAGDLKSFARAADNSLQNGNAIQIYYSADPNAFVRYYWDAQATALKRITNGSSTASNVVSSIASGSIFSLEDYSGKVLSNNQNGGVVGISLSFYSLQYTGANVASGATTNTYQVKAKINRRVRE